MEGKWLDSCVIMFTFGKGMNPVIRAGMEFDLLSLGIFNWLKEYQIYFFNFLVLCYYMTF